VNVAIIPARGGSKRIPKKNIRLFAGKPIIAYSIEVALASGLFERVIVSTDDEAIAETSRQFGAEAPFVRPSRLSDDFSGTNAVTAHAIEWLVANSKSDINLACCIYATAPFIEAWALHEGYNQLNSRPERLFAYPVTTFPFPIQRAIKITSNLGVEPFYPEHTAARSQDLIESFHDAGQFYWGRPQAFLTGSALYAPHSIPLILPRHRVQDIDTEEDWKRAEILYKVMQRLPS